MSEAKIEISNMPNPPEGHRWYLRRTMRRFYHVHLERRKSFLGFKWWKSVDNEITLLGSGASSDFFTECVRAARILSERHRDRSYPTGEITRGTMERRIPTEREVKW